MLRGITVHILAGPDDPVGVVWGKVLDGLVHALRQACDDAVLLAAGPLGGVVAVGILGLFPEHVHGRRTGEDNHAHCQDLKQG